MGVRELLAQNKYIRAVSRLSKGFTPVYVEFAIEFKPRWQDDVGNVHLARIISSRQEAMTANIASLAKFLPVVRDINAKRFPELASIDWQNHQIPAFDALTLMWAGTRAKRTYMEVGSGNSTL